MIRVEMPFHLRLLAQVSGEVRLELAGEATQQAIFDALEARFPMLRGTIRDHVTHARRAFLRFYACQRDLTFEPLDAPLPEAVARGEEAFLIIGALSGG